MIVPSFILIAVLVVAVLIFAAGRTRAADAVARPGSAGWRWLWGALAVLSFAFAALFAFAFHEQYWRWRDCFNELGRCYDPEESVVYLEQSGIVWGGMTGMAFVAAVVFTLLSSKK